MFSDNRPVVPKTIGLLFEKNRPGQLVLALLSTMPYYSWDFQIKKLIVDSLVHAVNVQPNKSVEK